MWRLFLTRISSRVFLNDLFHDLDFEDGHAEWVNVVLAEFNLQIWSRRRPLLESILFIAEAQNTSICRKGKKVYVRKAMTIEFHYEP